MNQPRVPSTELDALADEFATVLHSLSTENPAPHHLSGPLTTVTDLVVRLRSAIHDAHGALAAYAPADRPSHTSLVGPSAPLPTTPTAPASSAVPPTAAKGR
jgi:hypothetical protein